MSNCRIKVLGALLGLVAAGAPAWGADPATKWYAGLDFGESTLERDSSFAAVTAEDDSSESFALRVGYRFSPYFSLEAGYTDIGDFGTTYIPLCAITPPSSCPTAEARISLDGFLVNAVGTWPIAEHFHLKGVLGATYRELNASVSDPSYPSVGWSETNTAFSFGIGIAVPVNEHFEIDLDFTQYREIGLGLDTDSNILVTDEAEARQLMLGLRYRF